MDKQNKRDVNFVAGLKDARMKTHSLTNAEIGGAGDDTRIAVVFEAYVDTEQDQDCLATIYLYKGATNDVEDTFEMSARWQSAWDDVVKASLAWAHVEGL